MMLHAITRARREALVTARLDALAQALRMLPSDRVASRQLVQRYARAVGATISTTAADLVADAMQADSAMPADRLDELLFAAQASDRMIESARGR